MKSIFLAFFGVLSTLLIDAQTSFKPVSVNDYRSYLEKIEAASESYTTISCKFSQTRYSSMLKEPTVSRGYLHIKDRKKLRWECNSPYTYTFILNNGNGIILKNNRPAESASKSKRFPKEMSEFLLGGFTPELLMDKRKFVTSMFIGSNQLKIKLEPVQKRMKSALSLITICFDLKDYSISSIEIGEQSGDRTEIVLSEKKFNTPVSDSLFEVKK